MIPLHSLMENNIYPLYVLEERFKPGGSIIRTNWDYEQSIIELVINDQGIHYLMHIPFYAVQGSLDFPGVTIRLEKPYLLNFEHPESAKSDESDALDFSVANPGLNRETRKVGETVLRKVEELLLPG
ncbi:YugN family protein [Lentibacillus cibarius]|nr:YugN family protein [Lentibacillus cibarius]